MSHAEVLAHAKRKRLESATSRANYKPKPLQLDKPQFRSKPPPLLTRHRDPDGSVSYTSTLRPAPSSQLRGRRRIPVVFVTSQGVPFLRTKKPQPVRLECALRRQGQRRQARVTQAIELREVDTPAAKDEDNWERLVEGLQREEGRGREREGDGETFAAAVRTGWQALGRSLQNERLDWIAKTEAQQPGPHPQQPVYFVAHPPLVDPTAAAAAAAPGLVSSPPSSSGSTLCHPHDPRLLHASELQTTTIAWFPTSDEPSAVPQLHHYTAPSDFYDPNHDPHTTDDPTFYHRPYHHPHQQQRPLNWPFIQLPDGQTVLSMHPELSILNAESYHDGSASSFRAPRSLPPRPTPTPSTPGADEGRTRSHRVSRHGTKR
ncbi:hypothetical protein HYQ44_020317 [Verticillium longisporum]|nr:hypothetical protein HYQ44_020317 [Verticillium longisporum]